MLALTGLVALGIAVRAGRMSAVQAIAAGRAPRPRHGYRARRLLGRDSWTRLLPRPVTIGLAGPFARPGPTLVMLAAIVSGVTAVIFGFGLSTSLNRIQADLSHAAAEQVQVLLGGRQGQSLINGKSAAPASPAAQDTRCKTRCMPSPAHCTTSRRPAGRSACSGNRASCPCRPASAAMRAGPATR
jgi:putative ABC transport system permease protein